MPLPLVEKSVYRKLNSSGSTNSLLSEIAVIRSSGFGPEWTDQYHLVFWRLRPAWPLTVRGTNPL